MNQDRPAPDADRLIVAKLTGEARYHAKWRPLTGEERGRGGRRAPRGGCGRSDLLAQVAGILEGASEGELDEPLARCAAKLCRQARADLEAVPRWVQTGRERRRNAGRPPFSGPRFRRLLPGPARPRLGQLDLPSPAADPDYRKKKDAERDGILDIGNQPEPAVVMHDGHKRLV